MKELMNRLNEIKTIGAEEGSVTFTEDGFNSLYEIAVETSDKYTTDLKTATVKGVLIGAASTGLVGLGIWGFNKFRKRNSNGGDKNGVKKAPKSGKTLDQEVITIQNNGKIIKKAKVDKEALSAIIAELNENEKEVKH
jgi:hypothetical protein